MKIFRAYLRYGIAFIVARDIIEAHNLLKDDEAVIEVIEPYYVTRGFPAVIGTYQE